MEANPKLPTAGNGRQKLVNASMLPAQVAPGQVALSNQASAMLMPKWRAALAKVKTGSANARILCIGDSTTFGVYSNGTSSGNLKPNAWPTQLATLFNSAGINAHCNSIAGNGTGAASGNFQSNAADDSRVSLGSGWSASSTTTVGGQMYTCSAATSSFSFTPTVNVDTFTVFYAQGASGGSISWNINGGSNTTVSLTGTAQVNSFTVTAPLGTNTLNLNWVSNGSLTINIAGIEAYDSSKNWVSIINAGWPGSKSSDWSFNGGVYSSVGGAITQFAPSLTIIDLGINDQILTTSLGQYMANMQLLITVAKATGDVVLQTFNPTQINYSSVHWLGMQQALVSGMYTLAANNNIPLLDIYNRMQSWAITNANGMMGDQLHPNAAGYADKASAIFNFIGSL